MSLEEALVEGGHEAMFIQFGICVGWPFSETLAKSTDSYIHVPLGKSLNIFELLFTQPIRLASGILTSQASKCKTEVSNEKKLVGLDMLGIFFLPNHVGLWQTMK